MSRQRENNPKSMKNMDAGMNKDTGGWSKTKAAHPIGRPELQGTQPKGEKTSPERKDEEEE